MALRQNGIATAHISELFIQPLPESRKHKPAVTAGFPETDIFSKLREYATSLAAAPAAREKIAALEAGRVSAKGDLIVHLLGGYGGIQPVLSLSDPFIQFILSERILEIS